MSNSGPDLSDTEGVARSPGFVVAGDSVTNETKDYLLAESGNRFLSELNFRLWCR